MTCQRRASSHSMPRLGVEYKCTEEVGAWILGFTNPAALIIDSTNGYERAMQEAEGGWLDVRVSQCQLLPR